LERSNDRAGRGRGRKFKPLVLGEIQAAGDTHDNVRGIDREHEPPRDPPAQAPGRHPAWRVAITADPVVVVPALPIGNINDLSRVPPFNQSVEDWSKVGPVFFAEKDGKKIFRSFDSLRALR
jgi:hypothetical protein